MLMQSEPCKRLFKGLAAIFVFWVMHEQLFLFGIATESTRELANMHVPFKAWQNNGFCPCA